MKKSPTLSSAATEHTGNDWSCSSGKKKYHCLYKSGDPPLKNAAERIVHHLALCMNHPERCLGMGYVETWEKESIRPT